MITTRVPADVRRHHGAHAVRQHRGLVGRGRRLALHDRLGLGDLEGHAGRKLDGDRHAVMDRLSITAMPSWR